MSFCCTYEGIEPKKNMTVDFICCFLGLKTIQATPPKHDLGTSYRFFFKISDEYPRTFHMEVPIPGRRRATWFAFCLSSLKSLPNVELASKQPQLNWNTVLLQIYQVTKRMWAPLGNPILTEELSVYQCTGEKLQTHLVSYWGADYWKTHANCRFIGKANPRKRDKSDF